MISALHLLWIVPLAAISGFFMAALCAAAKDMGIFDGEDIDHWEEKDGDICVERSLLEAPDEN